MRKSRLAAKWAKRKDMLRRRAVPKGIPFDEKAFDAKFRAQIKKLDDKNSKKQKRLNEEEDSLKMELTLVCGFSGSDVLRSTRPCIRRRSLVKTQSLSSRKLSMATAMTRRTFRSRKKNSSPTQESYCSASTYDKIWYN